MTSDCNRMSQLRIRISWIFYSVVAVLLSIAAQAQLAIPEHGGVWVHDEANVLSSSMRARLETVLKAERDSTSNQIAILIIPSLQGQPLEDYGIRVATAWRLGTEKNDNGVLLLIAIQERQVRIEAGQGLEG